MKMILRVGFPVILSSLHLFEMILCPSWCSETYINKTQLFGNFSYLWLDPVYGRWLAKSRISNCFVFTRAYGEPKKHILHQAKGLATSLVFGKCMHFKD